MCQAPDGDPKPRARLDNTAVLVKLVVPGFPLATRACRGRRPRNHVPQAGTILAAMANALSALQVTSV